MLTSCHNLSTCFAKVCKTFFFKLNENHSIDQFQNSFKKQCQIQLLLFSQHIVHNIHLYLQQHPQVLLQLHQLVGEADISCSFQLVIWVQLDVIHLKVRVRVKMKMKMKMKMVKMTKIQTQLLKKDLLLLMQELKWMREVLEESQTTNTKHL